MSGRRKSMSDLPQPSSVTVALAEREQSILRTRTITSHDVKGFTQANSGQLPTVYLNLDNEANLQRITQEHRKKDNVGAHALKGRQIQFENIDKHNGQGPKLYEKYKLPSGDVIRHKSRSMFRPASENKKEELIDSLKMGPANILNLSYSRKENNAPSSVDDWKVGYKTLPPNVRSQHVPRVTDVLSPPQENVRRSSVSDVGVPSSIVDHGSSNLGPMPTTAPVKHLVSAKPRSMTTQVNRAPQSSNANGGVTAPGFFQRLFSCFGSHK